MPAEGLLNIVLQHYQDVHDAEKTDQIIGTTVHLLTQLSNPLNLGVLTSQLLTAPAIWHRRDGARTAMRVISIYNAAAARVRDREADGRHPPGGGLSCEKWTRAVVKGADGRSRRWQHLLVLTGVLLGMEGGGRRALPRSLRGTLERAVVTAANLALRGDVDVDVDNGPATEAAAAAAAAVVAALSLALPLLSEHHAAQVDCDALLPAAVWAITGEEGFCDARFLRAVDRDVAPGDDVLLLSWPPHSPSCQLLREMEKQPLMANMGPVAKLAAFAARHAHDAPAVLQAQEALLVFTGRALDSWRRGRFSGVDPACEGARLSPETLRTAWPLLWRVLRKLVFAVTAVLQAIVARGLLDARMLVARAVGPGVVAARSLLILRNMFFMSSRDDNSAFQAYTFAYMASLDVLGRDGPAAEAFLRDIQPPPDSSSSSSSSSAAAAATATHLDRTLDLYYLNVAEHLPLCLPTDACESLVVKPALAYLSQQEGPMTPSVAETFEAAHSAILSVLACPQHGALTARIAPFYIVKLFESFPRHLSPRQFRLAFKTVMQVVSPPFPIAAAEPHLSETLLEMLRASIGAASTHLLPPSSAGPDAASRAGEEARQEPLSEQGALLMTLVDSLPCVPLALVEEWLDITARAMQELEDPQIKAAVKKRFWDMLANGEMDVERSMIGVAWWGTKGGRDLVLRGGDAPGPPVMSGALGGGAPTSRL
ncbi:hypothetical protein UVI_02024790 [Ustilaginoidea virens]|uniref:Peroxisomal membrane protein Pex17 n=1 Tax=Ustilaginoidea virens TaxID=1159556 RepID=A0A1B5KQZ0_USTVR|nr:hypothetical protein UVI_02024790 [Ustilaginoidea virens]